MDLREAIACLDEYRISLANIGGMLRPNVADGELGAALGKLNDSLIETLNAQVKEARILSILIWEEMNATHAQMVEFPDEWADLLVALNQLKLATDAAAQARAEYLRKTAASNVNAKGTETANAIREFRRRHGLMTKEESEEHDRNMSPPNLAETLNTPDPTEV
jgi:hypothetical protein